MNISTQKDVQKLRKKPGPKPGKIYLKKRRPVLKISIKTGEILERYPSVVEAEKIFGWRLFDELNNIRHFLDFFLIREGVTPEEIDKIKKAVPQEVSQSNLF